MVSPSSATAGFIQAIPVIPPQHVAEARRSTSRETQTGDDAGLARVLALYLPQPCPEEVDVSLHEVAQISLDPSTLRLVADAETNVPTLHPMTTFGSVNNVDALRTGEGWRGLKDIGVRIGSVSLAYPRPDTDERCSWNRRVHQCAVSHLWSGSAALVTCPGAMTDGAAVLLGRHLQDADGDQPGRVAVLTEARKRLISSDPSFAWSSGQWMTERTGGSDVSETESVAERLDHEQLVVEADDFGCDTDNVGMPLGPWKVDGFKWFSSATDADMVILLARTSKGLGAFYAPMRRAMGNNNVMNGVRITRLKRKMGTRALPTSELEIKGMRAWLIGEEGRGIKEISAILNLTRIGTASGAVAQWSRGLAIARAYTRVRKVKGALLGSNVQHVRWMADESVKYRAALHLAFLGAALQGIIEQGTEVVSNTSAGRYLSVDPRHAGLLLRALTPVMKAQCSLAAVSGLRECMESLGGVGYCESDGDGTVLNIARLFRDTNVNPIWEGTVSVMVEDFVRASRGSTGDSVVKELDELIHRILNECRSKFRPECNLITTYWSGMVREIRQQNTEYLLYDGRKVLRSIESVVCACLLLFDAIECDDVVSATVARVWLSMRLPGTETSILRTPSESHKIDRDIFLGNSTDAHSSRARL